MNTPIESSHENQAHFHSAFDAFTAHSRANLREPDLQPIIDTAWKRYGVMVNLHQARVFFDWCSDRRNLPDPSSEYQIMNGLEEFINCFGETKLHPIKIN